MIVTSIDGSRGCLDAQQVGQDASLARSDLLQSSCEQDALALLRQEGDCLWTRQQHQLLQEHRVDGATLVQQPNQPLCRHSLPVAGLHRHVFRPLVLNSERLALGDAKVDALFRVEAADIQADLVLDWRSSEDQRRDQALNILHMPM